MDFYRWLFVILMFVVGAGLGSFACCTAWRIKLKDNSKRSKCLSCGHELKWFENIPIVSWIIQGGKCRKCGAKIGKWEIVMEILMGVVVALVGARYVGFMRDSADICGVIAFSCAELSIDVLSMPWYIFVDFIELIVLLAFMTTLGILFVYDARWGKMPERELRRLIILGVIYFILRCVSYVENFDTIGVDFSDFILPMIYSCVGGVAILSGVYYLLYFFSHETLVGSGDWMLCLGVALTTGDWFLSLIILFLSNMLACVYMMPSVLRKKKHMSTKVAFGPFVVVAFVIVYILQERLKWLLFYNAYF